jgi:hypothetical protein
VIGIIGFLSPADAASTVGLRVELEESGALAGVSITLLRALHPGAKIEVKACLCRLSA